MINSKAVSQLIKELQCEQAAIKHRKSKTEDPEERHILHEELIRMSGEMAAYQKVQGFNLNQVRG